MLHTASAAALPLPELYRRVERRIPRSLPKIRRAVETMKNEVTVDPGVVARARCAVDRMMALG